MDEFTSIGRVDIIASAVAYMAGYNVRLLPIIQSMAQLDATYGKDVARSIITNHALQIIYAPREQQDANDYSEMLGYTRSEEHTSELQSLMRISYAVFCLKTKNTQIDTQQLIINH